MFFFFLSFSLSDVDLSVFSKESVSLCISSSLHTPTDSMFAPLSHNLFPFSNQRENGGEGLWVFFIPCGNAERDDFCSSKDCFRLQELFKLHVARSCSAVETSGNDSCEVVRI